MRKEAPTGTPEPPLGLFYFLGGSRGVGARLGVPPCSPLPPLGENEGFSPIIPFFCDGDRAPVPPLCGVLVPRSIPKIGSRVWGVMGGNGVWWGAMGGYGV